MSFIWIGNTKTQVQFLVWNVLKARKKYYKYLTWSWSCKRSLRSAKVRRSSIGSTIFSSVLRSLLTSPLTNSSSSLWSFSSKCPLVALANCCCLISSSLRRAASTSSWSRLVSLSFASTWKQKILVLDFHNHHKHKSKKKIIVIKQPDKPSRLKMFPIKVSDYKGISLLIFLIPH